MKFAGQASTASFGSDTPHLYHLGQHTEGSVVFYPHSAQEGALPSQPHHPPIVPNYPMAGSQSNVDEITKLKALEQKLRQDLQRQPPYTSSSQEVEMVNPFPMPMTNVARPPTGTLLPDTRDTYYRSSPSIMPQQIPQQSQPQAVSIHPAQHPEEGGRGRGGRGGASDRALPALTCGEEEGGQQRRQVAGLELSNGWKVSLILAYVPLLVIYFLLFTEVGFGASVFKFMTKYGDWTAISAAGGVLAIVILYLADGNLGLVFFNVLLSVMGFLSFLLTVILTFRTMPYAPLLTFFFLMALYYVAIYFAFVNKSRDFDEVHVSLRSYLSGAAIAMTFGGMLALIVAIVWAAYYNLWWGEGTKNDFRNRLRVCKDISNLGTSPYCKSYGLLAVHNYGTACVSGCTEVDKMSACAIEWTTCAKEGETCKCDGRVRFGSLPTSSWDDPWAVEKMPGSFNASGLLCREATTQAPNTANASGFLKAFPEQKFGAERVCQCGKEQKACLASWILWASPFLISLFSMLFGVMLYFISQSATRRKSVPGQENKVLSEEANIFIYIMAGVFCLTWAGTSFMGANMELSRIVLAFAALAGSLGALMLFFALGWRDSKALLTENENLKGLKENVWFMTTMKALCILCFLPILVLYLLTSYLKRFIIRMRLKDGEEERQLTAFRIMAAWQEDDKTAILTRVVFVGALYFAAQVIAGQFTVLFLAWLNIAMSPLNCFAIAGIIIGVGIILMIFPPGLIPGVPVYLLCGIAIGTPEAERQLAAYSGSKEPSFALAMVLASAAAFITKMLSVVLTQLIFGELWGGRSVSIRSLTGVNTDIMKAIKLVLETNPVSILSMSILCGGPDWQVSTLCGILKLKYGGIFMGTCPSLIPIIFFVLTGGCMVKAGQVSGDSENVYGPLSSIFLVVAGGCLTGSGFYFTGALGTFMKDPVNAEKIAAIPNDEEVEAYDRAQEIIAAKEKRALEWSTLPFLSKFLLLLSVSSMIISFFIFATAGGQTFHKVEVTTDYRKEPLNGSFIAMVKPLGAAGMVIQLFSWVTYWLFSAMVSSRVAKLQDDLDAPSPPSQQEPSILMTLHRDQRIPSEDDVPHSGEAGWSQSVHHPTVYAVR